MANYISTLDLMDNTIAAESSEAGTFDDYCAGASRLFDLLCEVEDDFFAKTSNAVSEKTFYGDGIDMLRLPPFVAGSITEILIDDVLIADSYRLSNDYLINLDNDFTYDAEIKITAKWGFAEINAAVKVATQELANYLYRNRDPMFAKISDVEIEKTLSPTVNATIKKFRDKYGQGAF